jgi:hypothetical protein
MKQALMGVLLAAGLACGLNAQEAVWQAKTAANFSSDSQLAPPSVDEDFALSSLPAAEANAAPGAIPPAEPAAKPKYGVFGARDDYRWQLGVGLEYMRFQSRAFDANMVGLNTTLTYFTNTWFAVEGSLITGFGPTVFNSDNHAKIFAGTGGIRIGGRRARWEPFGHAQVGGSHLEPQTAYGGRSALLALAGGGVDYRVHSRLSFRGEADWVYTTYFSQTQNNLQIVAGVVLHF